MAIAERIAARSTGTPTLAGQVRRDLAKSTGQPFDTALRRRMENGKGSQEPKKSNDNEAGRASNRRVVMTVDQPDMAKK